MKIEDNRTLVVKKIEHLAIVVSDLQRAKDFFCTYFDGVVPSPDYHNPRTGLHSCFVTFDGDTRLELMQWGNLTSHSEAVSQQSDLTFHSAFHLSMSVGSKEQVDALTARLQSDGYTVKSAPRTTGDGYYESVIVPFDGIEVEITI